MVAFRARLIKDVCIASSRHQGPLSSHPSRRYQTFSLSRVLLVVAAAFILLDLLVYIYVARAIFNTSSLSIAKLELRNTYVGLDELYASGTVNSSTYDPIVNRPRFAAQVSSAEPNKVFPDGDRRVVSSYGLLSTPDHRLHVSSDVSFINALWGTATEFNCPDSHHTPISSH